MGGGRIDGLDGGEKGGRWLVEEGETDRWRRKLVDEEAEDVGLLVRGEGIGERRKKLVKDVM